jgi:hypothetical protein
MIIQGHQEPVGDSTMLGLGEGDGEMTGLGVGLGVGGCVGAVELGTGIGEPY